LFPKVDISVHLLNFAGTGVRANGDAKRIRKRLINMNNSVHDVCFKLRFLLEESVKRNLSEGMLLSGGLDTSVLAVIASKLVSLKAFTVGFEGAPAPDIEYATLVAHK